MPQGISAYLYLRPCIAFIRPLQWTTVDDVLFVPLRTNLSSNWQAGTFQAYL